MTCCTQLYNVILLRAIDPAISLLITANLAGITKCESHCHKVRNYIGGYWEMWMQGKGIVQT